MLPDKKEWDNMLEEIPVKPILEEAELSEHVLSFDHDSVIC